MGIKKILNGLGVFLFCVYLSYDGLLVSIFDQRARIWLLGLAAVLFFLADFVLEQMKFRVYRYMISWVLLVAIAVFYNYDLEKNILNIFFMIYILFYSLIIANNDDMGITYYAIFKKVALLTAVCSMLFLLMPSLYRPIYLIFDQRIGGTDGGQFGYRAGLTAHSSWQGILCSISMVIVSCSILVRKSCQKRIRKIEYIEFITFFSGLILSAKRGVLIFSIGTILVIYLLINRKKFLRKSIKIVVLTSSIIIVGMPYLSKIQAVSYLISRFFNQNDISSGRFELWKAALKCYRESPILGIGWLGYRDRCSVNLALVVLAKVESMDTHNVYLQVLCESGIIGFSIYLFAIISSLYMAYRVFCDETYNHTADIDKKIWITVVLAIQIFYLTYSMTGNCLYDYTFALYLPSCMSIYSSYRQLKKERCSDLEVHNAKVVNTVENVG